MLQTKPNYYFIKIAVLALFVIILCALNFAIYDKNQIKKQGEFIYLQLRPVDPRALMQGDYMALAYDLELQPKISAEKDQKKYMIIAPDANGVAQYVQLVDDKNEFKPVGNQKILKVNYKYLRPEIKPNAFFFQEGHGKIYEKAKYGIFKFKGTDTYILDGLADENRNRLGK